MNNDLQAHPTADKIKWILTLIAFIAVGIMLVGIILGWFDKKEPTQENDDSSLIVTPQEQTAMLLNASRAAVSGNSYTITATVTPDDATNKDISWSIAWKNPDSDWAADKNISDYITFTSSGDTATVALRTAFGEQAIITATSAANTEATATCSVDYVERLSIPHSGGYMDVERVYQNANHDQTFSFNTAMDIKAMAQYTGIGTVKGNVEFGQLSISISDSMRSYISSHVSGYNSKYTCKTITYNFANGEESSVNIANPISLFNITGNLSETAAAINNALIDASNAGHKIRMESTFTYSYDGSTIQSGQIIGEFTVSTNGLTIAVTGVNVDKNNITF